MAPGLHLPLAASLLTAAWLWGLGASGGVALEARTHLTVACWLAAVVVAWPRRSEDRRPILWWYLVGAGLTLAWSVAPVTQLSGWMLAIIAWATASVCHVLVRGERRYRTLIVGCIVVMLSAQALLGLWQAAHGELVRGTLRNPNHFAGAMALALGLALGIAVSTSVSSRGVDGGLPGPRGRRLGASVLSLLLLAVIVLGGSRGGLATATAVVAFVYVSCRWRHRQGRPVGGLQGPTHGRLGSVTSAVGLALWGGLITGLAWIFVPRVSVDGLERRLTVYQGTVAMILDHPWWGIGPGQYRWQFRPYQRFDGHKLFDHAHNDYLQLAAEWGLPFAVVLLAWIAWHWWRTWRMSWTIGGGNSLALPVTAALLAPALHGWIDFDLQIPAVVMPVAALVAWAATSSRNDWGGDGGAGGARRWLFAAVWSAVLVIGGLAAVRSERLAWADSRARGSDDPAVLERALAQAPDAPTLHFRLAMVRRDADSHRRPKAAHGHFLDAIRLNPHSWRYRFELGRFYERFGRPSEAAVAYGQALALNPWDADYQHRIGSFYLRTGTARGQRQGLALLARAVAEDPRLLAPTGELLLSMFADPERLVAWWPRQAGAQQTLLNVLCRWFMDRPAGTVEGELLDAVWQRWLSGDRRGETDPEGVDLQRGDVYIRYLMQRGRVREARRQWLRLAAADESLPKAALRELTAGRNELWNGDFELPLRRSAFTWQVPRVATQAMTRVPGEGVGGSHALRIDFDSTAKLDFRRLRQHLVLRPETVYELDFRTRSDGLVEESGISVQILAADSRRVLWQGDVVSGTTPWQRHTGTFKLPAATDHVILRLAVQASPGAAADHGKATAAPSAGRYWLDAMGLAALDRVSTETPGEALDRPSLDRPSLDDSELPLMGANNP